MLQKANQLLNIVISTIIGFFIGYGIYAYWHYRTYPELHAMQSAPWYTGVILYGIFTLIVLALCMLLKAIIKWKMKK